MKKDFDLVFAESDRYLLKDWKKLFYKSERLCATTAIKGYFYDFKKRIVCFSMIVNKKC